jgi:hypothetical protein
VVDAPRAQALLGDEASALGPEQRLRGDADVLVADLRVAAEPNSSWGCSIVATSRRISTPGVPVSTRNMEARWCGRASGSVTAMTIRKSAMEAFEENHLWPEMTQEEPSRTARVRRSVGSAPALGSVMENADRRSPARSGCR